MELFTKKFSIILRELCNGTIMTSITGPISRTKLRKLSSMLFRTRRTSASVAAGNLQSNAEISQNDIVLLLFVGLVPVAAVRRTSYKNEARTGLQRPSWNELAFANGRNSASQGNPKGTQTPSP